MNNPGVTIITCTGGRPEAFALCKRFIERQTYTGPLQWIVVDDGAVPSMGVGDAIEFSRRHLLTIILPEPKWQSGQNTLARNLLAAIPEIRRDKILFFEDDDRVSPDYVEAMATALESAELAGETHARYYHVPLRRFRLLGNTTHASLCQTAMRASLLPTLREICENDSQEFIDVQLWCGRNVKKNLFDGKRVVGIKGLPGRPGIGIGHRPNSDWTADPQMTVLRSWIGDDVTLYEGFHA